MAAKINMRLDKNEMPSQDPNVRNKNFLEVALGYTEEQALDEAARCLHCKNHPCVDGCPVNVRIPEFIAKIVERDYEGAYQVIHQTSSLPAVCGRVCPQESQCEMHCVRGKKGDPVGIGRLERFVADWHREHFQGEPKMPVSNGHKVAVIGSGPSGLTAAGDLAKMGYKVTVYEALHTPGGVLVYGIPEFRLPKEIVRQEIDGLKKIGVDVETNVVIGRTLTIDEISRMVRVSYDPATQDTLEQADGQPWIEWEDAGPVACEAGWDHYRHDSGVSRTWEMCDPPKSNVTSSTLARLLGPLSDCDRKRVTVVFHVLPPDKTAFMAEQNRQRAANQVSQEKRASISAMSQINKANRQAIETNRGAAIVFFGMLVTATVRAGDDERMRLEQATHAVEGAAGSAKIDLRPCYGAQDTAFAASLPLGLNLRNYTPPSAFAALS